MPTNIRPAARPSSRPASPPDDAPVPGRAIPGRATPERSPAVRSAPGRSAGKPQRPFRAPNGPAPTIRNPKAGPFKANSFKGSPGNKPEPKILFQKFFKSVGPRTYAAQVKELANGNQMLVLTEGKRDPETGEVRKTRLFVYAEDFTAFFRMLHETAGYLRANPLPEEIRQRRAKFWAKKSVEDKERANGNGAADKRF